MKKRIYLLSITLASAALLFLSSCLKDDSHLVNFGNSGTFVDFPLGGLTNFGTDAVTAAPDSASGLITITFAVNIASVNLPTTATVVTMVANDPNDIAALNKAQTSATYLPMPTAAFKLSTTTVTIPAGKQYAELTISFNKALLDPSKSYACPVRIVSGTGAKLTANLNVHYYHFIGNDFAGVYRQTFRRWNAPDSISQPLNGNSFTAQPVTFVPIGPTEFTVTSGYAGNLVSYDVNFTKNADGTYTNFTVQILPSDLAVLTANSISLVQNAKFVPKIPDGNLTYAQALKLFYFQWIAATSSDRYLTDQYYK